MPGSTCGARTIFLGAYFHIERDVAKRALDSIRIRPLRCVDNSVCTVACRNVHRSARVTSSCGPPADADNCLDAGLRFAVPQERQSRTDDD